MDYKDKEKKIALGELELEELDQEVTKAQKKAAIAEAERTYGKDWKKTLWGALRSVKINRETLHTLHGLGTGSGMRDLNDPRHFRDMRPRQARTVEEVYRE